MNIAEAKKKIDFVKEKLLEMQKISSFIDELFKDNETIKSSFTEIKMQDAYPEKNALMHACWEEIEKNVPPGFEIDSNLVRHLSFNEIKDWFDIAKRDIPRELVRIEEYKRKLVLIEYLEGLHSEVSRVTEIVLNGDLDAALKVVYSNLDSRVRYLLKIPSDQPTTHYIAKAFKEGKLIPPHPGNRDGVRNFLMGVFGYYRNWIVHNTLPHNLNRLEATLSLFVIAHEANKLLDVCSKHLTKDHDQKS